MDDTRYKTLPCESLKQALVKTVVNNSAQLLIP